MRARVFFPLLAAGTVARVTLIYFVGSALSDPITDVTQFVSRYALIITPITIGITGLQLWHGHHKRRRLLVGTVEHLERDFADTEAEVASEATVTAPREID